jgi:cysteate synthase
MNRHYHLSCVACGKAHEDSKEGFFLDCTEEHPPSLLRAVYNRKDFNVREDLSGIFRYLDWLPVRRSLECGGRPVVYRSERLAGKVGLERLFVAFSGYWPERGAGMETCSFKELEALAVLARIPLESEKSLVVSSAGNTARAFLQIASLNRIPILVVVPESALPDMWMTVERHPVIRLAVVKGNADYLDAIELGNAIATLDGFHPEGGARNIARRDGMGTVLLSAVEELGEIPAHYFQAVGSGTGAIAAWEMAVRLTADGRFGSRGMRLHLVQNEPFAIMTRAWQAGSRELPPTDPLEAKKKIALMHSRVLSNRKPPYGIAGGVFDALSDTGGLMYSVSNEEAREAGGLFESLEGVDLDPAAEVALAGMIQAVKAGSVNPEETVLLNVTGGGSARLAAEGRARKVEPDFIFTPEDAKRIRSVETLLIKAS